MFSRPDLLARLKIMQADLLRDDNQTDAALMGYGAVLTLSARECGPQVVEAMRRVDQMLHTSNELGRLAAIYQAVWTRMPRPEASAFVRYTPYWAIGEMYATELDEMQETSRAGVVRSKMDGLNSGVAGRPMP
jgi:hypothetical protein